MNIRQQIALAVVNLILVIELCVTMYFGSQDRENLTSIFLLGFFGVMIPTFIVGKIVVGRLRSKVTDADHQPETVAAEAPAAELPLPVCRVDHHEVAEATSRYRASMQAIAPLEKKRLLAGRLTAFLLIVLIVSLLDSCVARMRQPLNVVDLVPGASTQINGPLDGKVKNTAELTYTRTSEHLSLAITDLYQGFWLGGTEWTGTLTLSPAIEPGEYSLAVMIAGKKSDNPPPHFKIIVHADATRLQKTSKSLIELYTGVYPWWVVAVVFPLTGLMFAGVYLLARRAERAMAEAGMAEVYWMREDPSRTAIAFALGTEQGVKTGCVAAIFDEKGTYVGAAEVDKAEIADAMAVACEGVAVKIGYTVVAGNRRRRAVR